MSNCNEERFLRDVKEHKMFVERDEGLSRHVRFKRPGTICYSFDLITWPGHLCISGDCGTYVFSRIDDMFDFFRTGQSYKDSHPEQKLFINAGYWGQKLLSICRQGGYKEFDEDGFRERVTDHYNMWVGDDDRDDEFPKELWSAIEEEVLSKIDNGEHAAYAAVQEFRHSRFQFEDFFDGGGCERPTFHYLWCLYAIAWGIEQYDASKKLN